MQEVLTNQDIVIGLNSIKNSQPLFMIWFVIMVGFIIFTLLGTIRKTKNNFKKQKKSCISDRKYIKFLTIYMAILATVCVVMVVTVCFMIYSNLQFQKSIRDAIENDTWFIEIRAVTKKSQSSDNSNHNTLFFDEYIYNNVSFDEFSRTQYGDVFYLVMVPDVKGVPYPELFYSTNKYIYIES